MTLSIDIIIDYAKKNDLSYEAYSSMFDRYGDKTLNETFIGLELKPNVYFWWTTTKDIDINTDILSKDRYSEGKVLFFDHRYNRVNGASQKSYSKGFKAERTILSAQKTL